MPSLKKIHSWLTDVSTPLILSLYVLILLQDAPKSVLFEQKCVT